MDFDVSSHTANNFPSAGENNLWFLYRNSNICFVFVHGIFSDSRSCWLHVEDATAPEVYWPHLISQDERFHRYSIFLGGYYTALDAGSYKVRHCADELYQALRRREMHNLRSVLEHEAVIFICHSTGGIVTRYMLDAHTSDFENKTIGLILIASPSYGSALASLLSLLSNFYNQQLAKQLEWGNDSLDSLDERFHRLISERRIPRLVGMEAYENHFVFHRKWLPNRIVVVTKESAERYFPPARMLAKTNHFTSVKPTGPRHPAHLLLVDFCSEIEESQTQTLKSDQEVISEDLDVEDMIAAKLAEVRTKMIAATSQRDLEEGLHEVEATLLDHPKNVEARQLRGDFLRSLENLRRSHRDLPEVLLAHAPARSMSVFRHPRFLAASSLLLLVTLSFGSLMIYKQNPKTGRVGDPSAIPKSGHEPPQTVVVPPLGIPPIVSRGAPIGIKFQNRYLKNNIDCVGETVKVSATEWQERNSSDSPASCDVGIIFKYTERESKDPQYFLLYDEDRNLLARIPNIPVGQTGPSDWRQPPSQTWNAGRSLTRVN
jgi:hypothetical protein